MRASQWIFGFLVVVVVLEDIDKSVFISPCPNGTFLTCVHCSICWQEIKRFPMSTSRCSSVSLKHYELKLPAGWMNSRSSERDRHTRAGTGRQAGEQASIVEPDAEGRRYRDPRTFLLLPRFRIFLLKFRRACLKMYNPVPPFLNSPLSRRDTSLSWLSLSSSE